jgi:hypothetical protein
MIKYLVESESKYEKNSRIKYFQRQFDLASNLYSKNLKAHFSCVNAIEFSNSSELFASGLKYFFNLYLLNFILI